MSQEPTSLAVYIGVHLAVDRVYVSAVTEKGDILVESSAAYAAPKASQAVKGQLEINPDAWWESTRIALGHLVSQMRTKVVSASQLRSLSVSSVSGAIVTLDRHGNILYPAILGDDMRAVDQVTSLNSLGADHCRRMGFQFKPTYALAKIAWIKENFPEMYENAVFVHQADYIIGKLKGEFDVTEFSLAMRTGCDLIDECWPDWIDYDMHLSARERLPKLVPFGTPVGKITSKASAATGLPTGMTVVMGTVAETAAFLASGARKVGDFNTAIHDVLTISAISCKMIKNASGTIRAYKLPGSEWFLTTETRTGAEWIAQWFSANAFQELEKEASELLPTTYLAYPNARKGETFPFSTSTAEGFISPATDNRIVQFASCLQGTALFERLCYQKLDRMADNDEHGCIYSGGDWCGSDIWMQCRADVTGRINHSVIGRGGASFGTAMIAAIGGGMGKLENVADEMIHVEKSFFPNPERVNIYSEHFENFCNLMMEQGYAM